MTPADLRARREALRLSRQALAERLGVQVMTVYRWETMRRAIPPMLDLAMQALEAGAARPVH